PFRLARWPIAALALLPWLLAAGFAQSGGRVRTRVGVYAGQTVAIVAGLALAGATIPGLFIVVLLVPALPLVFAAMALAGGVVDDPWAYAVGNALFFSWLLVALFPLAG
ncbi:MAG TPA: alpha/beta hydrolase, partial [Spirochaetia bacterium]|nr:alpha/beta hydrolase [Spirochaetia bacterium]